MLLNGLSAGLMFMPITSTILGGVEPEHAGAASGLLQTFQQLGGAVGLAVIVSVYAAGSVPGEFLPGAQAAFLTSAIMAALAGVAGRRGARHAGVPSAVARGRLRPRRPPHVTHRSVVFLAFNAAEATRTVSYLDRAGAHANPHWLSRKRITSL